jgi:hypothetical protein
MSTNYTPAATDHATIPIPDDGDDAVALSFSPAYEALADNIEFTRGQYKEVSFNMYASAAYTALVETNSHTYGTGDYNINSSGIAVRTGDVIDISLNCNLVTGASITHGYVRLATQIGAGAVTAIDGSETICQESLNVPLHMRATKELVFIGGPSTVKVWVQALTIAGSNNVTVDGPFNATISIRRAL